MPRSLPHLDIAVWRSDPSRFARQLRLACHHDGFLQLRHRIPTPLVEHVKSEARNFFAQDAEHKHAIDYRGSPAFRGYMACGVENTAGRPDLREQVEIAAEGGRRPKAMTRTALPGLPFAPDSRMTVGNLPQISIT